MLKINRNKLQLLIPSWLLLCVVQSTTGAPSVHNRAYNPDSVRNKGYYSGRQVYNLDEYGDRKPPILHMIQHFLRNHLSEISDPIEEVLNNLQQQTLNKNPTGSEQTLVCQVEAQCKRYGNFTDLMSLWHQVTGSLLDDKETCKPCESLVEFGQQLVCWLPWELMRAAFVWICENVTSGLQDNDPVMCDGLISLQGQHLYCIFKEADAHDMCESFNMCYPNIASTTPVRERTPWAVKGSLHPVLHEKLSEREQGMVHSMGHTLKVIQLTDLHIQPKYAIGSPSDCKARTCCLEDSLAREGTPLSRRWGEYNCNLPERTMRKFLEKVNDFNPDLVIYTGDSAPHTYWDQTLTSQLNCSNIVVNAMKSIFPPGLRVYPTLGNHETFPTNLYSKRMPETIEITQGYTRMWHDLAGFDATANNTWTDLSYYTMLHQPGLRILSLNSLFDWATGNLYNTLNNKDTENEEHKNFIENTLLNARKDNQKVIVINHHPISSAIIRTALWWEQIATEYSDVIILHLSGHTHKDEIELVIDKKTDLATSTNHVGPSVTTNSNINPSLTVYELHNETFDLVDFQRHHYRLDKQLPDEEPEIVLNYDARTEYDMLDLSPIAWQELTLRFLDNDTLFQVWYSNRNAKAPRGGCPDSNRCDTVCKIAHICGIWFPRQDEYEQCIDSWPEPEPTQGTSGTTSVSMHIVWHLMILLDLVPLYI